MQYFKDVYPDMGTLRAYIIDIIATDDLTEEQKNRFIKQLDNLIRLGFDEVDVYLKMHRAFKEYLEEKDLK